jgi:hypothetical protein
VSGLTRSANASASGCGSPLTSPMQLNDVGAIEHFQILDIPYLLLSTTECQFVYTVWTSTDRGVAVLGGGQQSVEPAAL